jgi:hypothetical protein
MRLLLACAAAVAAVAFAAPSFAQETAPAAAPMTTPAKPKVGTTAYCNSLKSTSSKTTCLKRLHASAAKPAVPASTRKAKAKKTPTDAMAAPKETSAQLSPPAAAPTPTPVQQAQPSTIVVPPLPQKTI